MGRSNQINGRHRADFSEGALENGDAILPRKPGWKFDGVRIGSIVKKLGQLLANGMATAAFSVGIDAQQVWFTARQIEDVQRFR